MRLKSLVIGSFRNISQVCVEPGDHFNLFHGLNGQGKTNLLEAVYLLGNARSFRGTRLNEYIRHGDNCAHIRGEIASGGTQSLIRVMLEPGGRRTDIDGKNIQRAS